MRTLITFGFACSLLVHAAHGQLTDLAWLRQTTNAGVADGALLAVDATGNMLVAGAYPTSGITLGGITLLGTGSMENTFLAKLAPDGTCLWAKRMTRVGGTQDESNPDKIAFDAAGNVYLAGWYLGEATVDGTLLTGEIGYFLAKFSSMGDLMWTRTALTEDNI